VNVGRVSGQRQRIFALALDHPASAPIYTIRLLRTLEIEPDRRHAHAIDAIDQALV
jgi:hypothetical protein